MADNDAGGAVASQESCTDTNGGHGIDAGKAGQSRRFVLIEMSVVLSFAVLPDLVNALMWRSSMGGQEFEFVATNIGLITRSVAVACPMLYIMAHSGTDLASFGIRKIRFFRDGCTGLVIFACATLLLLWGAFVWQATGIGGQPTADADIEYGGLVVHSATEAIILLLALLLNSFAEELVMRSYLISRLERLIPSTWLCVLLSSCAFASYHYYQGWYGMIAALLIGIVFGAAFLVQRRLWPLVVAHTLFNLLSAVQVSYYGY